MLAGIVMAVISIAYGAAVSITGGFARRKLQQLANKIANKIQNNNTAISQLMEAYQKKDSKLAQAFLQGSGFGARAESIIKQQNKNEKEYEEKKRNIEKDNEQLSNQYSNVVNEQTNTGTITQSAEILARPEDELVNGGYNADKSDNPNSKIEGVKE